MGRIIKVTEDEVYVGKEDGQILVTAKSNAGWNVAVGDEVDIFNNGDTVLLSLHKEEQVEFNNNVPNPVSNPVPTYGPAKKKNPFVNFLNKFYKFNFVGLFTTLFVVFLSVLITLSVMPHGFKYTGTVEMDDETFNVTVKMLDYNLEMIFDDGDNQSAIPSKYTIKSGTININGIKGTVSATNLKFKYNGVTLTLKEKKMTLLRNTSIALMIIFGLLDVGCIVINILQKKGVVKINPEKEDRLLKKHYNKYHQRSVLIGRVVWTAVFAAIVFIIPYIKCSFFYKYSVTEDDKLYEIKIEMMDSRFKMTTYVDGDEIETADNGYVISGTGKDYALKLKYESGAKKVGKINALRIDITEDSVLNSVVYENKFVVIVSDICIALAVILGVTAICEILIMLLLKFDLVTTYTRENLKKSYANQKNNPNNGMNQFGGNQPQPNNYPNNNGMNQFGGNQPQPNNYPNNNGMNQFNNQQNNNPNNYVNNNNNNNDW